MTSLFQSVGGLLVDTFVVSGVVWPYIAQIRSMQSLKDASGFSTFTSLILIVSATLRIFFWFGARYGIPLLLQAIASILTQLYIMRVIVKINREKHVNGINNSVGIILSVRKVAYYDRSILDFRSKDFWNWTDWESYLLAELGLVVILTTLSGIFHLNSWYTDLLGTCSLGIEALLPLPQVLKNYRRQNTIGLSTVLIASWFAGDAFKTVYAIMKNEPMQFIACGAFQLCVDCVLVGQIFFYKSTIISPTSTTSSSTGNNFENSMDDNQVFGNSTSISTTVPSIQPQLQQHQRSRSSRTSVANTNII